MLRERDIARLHQVHRAPAVPFDCGERCSPSNGGHPYCCDDANALPVLYRSELVHLRRRTEMWTTFRARDEEEERLAGDLPPEQCFARCLGPSRCEREHRSLSCRSFPFYPYFTADGAFFGLGYYWEYAGRCWILERHELVQREFVEGFVRAWEIVFEKIPEERPFFRDFSARARGTHTRLGRPMVVIDRRGRGFVRRPGAQALEPIG